MTKDFTKYADKSATPNHETFAAWLREQTGVEVDLKTVQLAISLYGDFQSSDTSRQRREQAAVQRDVDAQAKRDAAKQRAQERLAKLEAQQQRAQDRMAKLEATKQPATKQPANAKPVRKSKASA